MLSRKRAAVAGAVATALACLLGVAPAGAHPEIDSQIADVTRRIEAAPDDASLFLRRGELHRIHREWDLAAADFARALELEPSLHHVHLSAGRMELDAGRPRRAVRSFDRFLSLEPASAKALGLKGRALAAMGKHLAAAKAFDAALAVDDGVAEFYLERARALQAAGNAHLARALAGLDAGIERLGKAPTLELLAVDLELERGAVDAAILRIDRVVAMAGRKDPWLYRKAEILEAAGRLDDARRVYEDVLRRIEELPESRRGSRAARELAGQTRAALERLPAGGGS